MIRELLRMPVRDLRSRVSGRIDHVPVLEGRPSGPVADETARVILLHGLSASSETMIPEMDQLSASGFVCLAPDAPHHGERADGFLDRMRGTAPTQAHACLLDIIIPWIEELTGLMAELRAQGMRRLAVVGVSMGGHAALGSMLHDPRPDVCIPLISTPCWERRRNEGARDPRDTGAPRYFPERFPPTPLLAITAGRDSIVPPEPMRQFVESLRPRYADFPERLRYLEFPESDHCMRQEDWQQAWREVAAWLDRWL